MTDFTHIHKDFENFSRFYTEDLYPRLAKKENLRLEKLAFFKKARIGAIAAGVLAFVSIFIAFDHLIAAIIIAALVGSIGFGIGYYPLGEMMKEAHSDIMPQIASQLGLNLQAKDFEPPAFERFRHYKLLPSYDRVDFEDLLTGARHGADFAIYEAHLENEHKDKDGNSSWSTAFHGQIFRIDYHREFLSETVIRRDTGFFNRFGKPGENFKQVGISSPRFEKAFEAWSTDQMEARYLLDPIVLERFLELENLYDGKNVRAAFAEGALYLALETGDRMAMGSAFKALDSQDSIETILKEFAAIYDLIDVMIKPTQGRTKGTFSIGDVQG